MISIIVPIYNIAKYLPQCLKSICNQTYQDLEVILVDDGSTDESGAICDSFAAGDERIKVLHKENGGLVSARKAGLQLATGEYIGYVDGDDWIEPDMYEKLYHALISQKVDIAMCGRFEDLEDSSKAVLHGIAPGRYDKGMLIEKVYPYMIVNDKFFRWGIFPGVWDKLFRKECMESYQMAVDEQIVMGEDAACTYPCLLHADSIYILDCCLYHYRQTGSSMVKKIGKKELERAQFHSLYQTVMQQLTTDIDIYDMRKQWEQYVLFLMIPRSDGLYDQFESLDFLFPFPKVKRQTKIILYGAGTYGQRLYHFIRESGFCEIVAWVDRNWKEIRKLGFEVISPDEIDHLEFDQIVVAITYFDPKMAVYKFLCNKYEEKMISLIDEELIFSKKSKKALGIEC